MPLYAGVCETNITPPLGVTMSGYGFRPSGATGVHDELFARALVLDNGETRLVVVVADVIAFSLATVERVRQAIAERTQTTPNAVMLHATHTHGGPHIGIFRGMGEPDAGYLDILERKLIGVATQAASRLQAAHLTYGEVSAQIGCNRRQTLADGRTILGTDFAGAVIPTVQALCVNGGDGRLLALLFCHACHPTTLGGENLQFTAEWCGAAVAYLKERFRKEAAEGGVAPNALPFSLTGCCGDINPQPRGSWELMEAHGRAIGEAAHAARWNAHGRLDETLHAEEMTVLLPMLPPPSVEECETQIQKSEPVVKELRARRAAGTLGGERGRLDIEEGLLGWAVACREIAATGEPPAPRPFAIQCLNLGGVQILGMPGEIFSQYGLDFMRQSHTPAMPLGYTNGCWNYVPTAAEYARGGYEVDMAYKYYGDLMYAPECEGLIRAAVYSLLGVERPTKTPYPLQNGRSRA